MFVRKSNKVGSSMNNINKDVLGRGVNGKALLLVLKLGASAGLVGYLCFNLDFHVPPRDATTFALLGTSVMSLLVQPVLVAARWRRLLHAFGLILSMREAIRIIWISVFAGQFLPSSVGADIVRISMCRTKGFYLSNTIMSILMDRGFALFSLLTLVLLFAPFLLDADQRKSAVFVIGGLATVGVASLVLIIVLAPKLKQWMARLPSRARWQRLVESSYLLISNPKATAVALTQSMIVHLLTFEALVAIAYAFGVKMPFMNLVALSAVITLAHNLPISIAGWGVREVASVALFSTAGVDGATALSISLLLGGGIAVASLPGAILWLIGSRSL
jgi:uncharacterized protein (TIRG00374 family)